LIQEARTVKARIGMAAAIVTGMFAVGCGSDDKGSSAATAATETTSTTQHAIAEVGAVRTGLAEALATYKAGDAATADDQVGDAYLRHFELVEGPLEEVDHELKEELEHEIREELRGKIRAGAPARAVEALVTEIEARLDEADKALR
jgi:hypothetical protein